MSRVNGAEAGVEVRVLSFDELSPAQVYGLARLRQDVFVVEQECAYPDLDGRDLEPGTRHLLLTNRESHALLGYSRVLAERDHERIGRVLLARHARGQGLADVMMRAAVDTCSGRAIVLDAQSPLADWYATFGFVVVGPEFLEDEIPHLPMRRDR